MLHKIIQFIGKWYVIIGCVFFMYQRWQFQYESYSCFEFTIQYFLYPSTIFGFIALFVFKESETEKVKNASLFEKMFILIITFAGTSGMLFIATCGFVSMVNIYAGKNVHMEMETRLSDKNFTGTKRRPHYLLTLYSDELGRNIEIETSRSYYNRVKINDEIQVKLIKGSLGLYYMKR